MTTESENKSHTYLVTLTTGHKKKVKASYYKEGHRNFVFYKTLDQKSNSKKVVAHYSIPNVISVVLQEPKPNPEISIDESWPQDHYQVTSLLERASVTMLKGIIGVAKFKLERKEASND